MDWGFQTRLRWESYSLVFRGGFVQLGALATLEEGSQKDHRSCRALGKFGGSEIVDASYKRGLGRNLLDTGQHGQPVQHLCHI